jgi:hypothetical protein
VDWRADFGEARIANAQSTKAAAEARAEELRRTLGEALERWYATDESLKALEQQHWKPLLRGAGAALTDEAVRRLRAALTTPVGGASPSPETMIDLHAVGLDLAVVGRAALATLERTDTTEPFRIPVKLESVPVRKSPADWLLFRSAASVAVRLFGQDRAQQIAPEVKQRRLPARSRKALHGLIDATLREKFLDLPVTSSAHLLEHYIEKFRQGVLDRLRERHEQALRDRAERQGPCEQLGTIAAAAASLREQTVQTRAAVLDLAAKASALPLREGAPVTVAFPAGEVIAPTVVRGGASA